MACPTKLEKEELESLFDDETPSRAPSDADHRECLTSRFVLRQRVYKQQFSHIYFLRLLGLRGPVKDAAERKWVLPAVDAGLTPPPYVEKVLDVRPGEVCYIIGTVYVDMTLKPNILHDVANEVGLLTHADVVSAFYLHHVAAPPPRSKYTGDGDSVALEDESGRVQLTGTWLKKGIHVSGIIMAILGSEKSASSFEVLDFCLPGLAPQKPLSCLPGNGGDIVFCNWFVVSIELQKRLGRLNSVYPTGGDGQSKYVALVSCLRLGNGKPLSAETEILIEYLTGELGSELDREQCSRIVHVVLAGNLLAKPVLVDDDKKPCRCHFTASRRYVFRDTPSSCGLQKRYGQELAPSSGESLRNLDALLERICETVTTVDVMPGETDPSNVTLPQQPMHPSLFPKARRYSSFNSVPNPYWMSECGVTFLGNSGQPLADIDKYLSATDRLEMAVSTLNWRHMAPTAPDTLWCYPFTDQDPFIMTESPHVYFIGNQPEFMTRVVDGEDGQRVRVVLVPSFEETGTVVLVDLVTLDCHLLHLRKEF
ncbi:MAG: DNA polymerase alpha/epsilon subunit B-domain-containing protein [Olpidium bornovanus]|uniref:DNA polymerase alpha/epsilon subunit B-domain-containing protein n=1 Tax=Olpidium bornovanus TaxID=278681 RepID=A0A8H7ZRX4_9FUNG|nr:MAG: DNA polymerase alpha/epsilon subunit B-domain-containing protein [Olpidium bornovanus]